MARLAVRSTDRPCPCCTPAAGQKTSKSNKAPASSIRAESGWGETNWFATVGTRCSALPILVWRSKKRGPRRDRRRGSLQEIAAALDGVARRPRQSSRTWLPLHIGPPPSARTRPRPPVASTTARRPLARRATLARPNDYHSNRMAQPVKHFAAVSQGRFPLAERRPTRHNDEGHETRGEQDGCSVMI